METMADSWATPAPIRIAFFDLDGTLAIASALHPLPLAVKALEQLREHGVSCILSSGRSPANLSAFPLGLFDGMVYLNGQYCLMDGRPIRELRFSKESLDALYALAQTTQRALSFQGPDTLFACRRSEQLPKVYGEYGKRLFERGPEDIYTSDIYQASIGCNPDEEEIIAASVPGCEIVRWDPRFVDLIPAGGGKGGGVAAVLDHLGLEREEAVAFGDSQNDISMFAACGTSVAMGNGFSAVKAAATYVTDAVDDDGVYRACVRLGLV